MASSDERDPTGAGLDAGQLATLDFALGRAVERALAQAPASALMLGGGLASAALACYARRAGIQLPAHGLAVPDADELAHARAVAQHLGLGLTEHVVTPDALRLGFDAVLGTLPGPDGADPAAVAMALLAQRLRTAGFAAVSGDALATLDAGVAAAVAALPQRPGIFRTALRALMADRLPAAVVQRLHVPPSLPPSVLLHGLQGRLLAAIERLHATPPPALDLAAASDHVRRYYAGDPVSSRAAFQHAVALLWWAEVRPPPPAPSTAPRQRLVVYTALVGAKEALADPLADLPPGATSDLDLDFVCITDNPQLRSKVWRIVTIPDTHLPPEKLSRRPKALPHEYFPDARYSLYVDNTVTFKRLPQHSDLATARPALFRAFRHATRSNPEQEAGAIALLGYDDVGTVCSQLAFYAAQQPLDSLSPLTTATVLLRDHQRPEIRRFGVLWWESILAFSKRDQLSFDFALHKSGAAVEYFDGYTHDNPLIRWQGSLSQHRVKASFDAKRYAWAHRADPEAQRDPKAHFLRHGAGRGDGDAAYLKPGPLLEYLSWTQQSSLGQQVSPRRGIAGALDALLAPHRRDGVRYLLARVQGSSAPRAFDAGELDAATKVISIALGPARGTLIDLAADTLADGSVYTAAAQPFGLVVVLGAAGEQLAAVLQKLLRLTDPEAGAIVLALTSPATLQQAAACEALLHDRLPDAGIRSSLQASSHDDLREPLPNTVLGIQWSAVVAQAALSP